MAHIKHYQFGRIVVDGQEERRDLIILPDRVVRNWWRRDGLRWCWRTWTRCWRTSPSTW
jgi:hypothetical protein